MKPETHDLLWKVYTDHEIAINFHEKYSDLGDDTVRALIEKIKKRKDKVERQLRQPKTNRDGMKSMIRKLEAIIRKLEDRLASAKKRSEEE